MKRRIAKAKPIVAKGRKKKKPKVELVETCDHCGRPFSDIHSRTVGSAACSNIDGIIAGEVAGRWMFFCGWDCAISGTSDKAVRWACGKDSMLHQLKKRNHEERK